MQKETKQTLVGLTLFGSMFLSPLVILEIKRDSRVFDIKGQNVWISQNRSGEGGLEMYTGMGFAGNRSFDGNNDGKLDISQWEIGTPRRPTIVRKEEVTDTQQTLYEQVRRKYFNGQGEVKGLVGTYNSVKDSIKGLFKSF